MQQGLRQRVQQRGHRLCRILGIARVAPDDSADLAQVELLGEGRRRWNRSEGEEAVQLPGSVWQEVPISPQHLRALLDRPEGRAADDRVHLMEAEKERSDDAEIAAAAPDRPMKVTVLIRRGADPLAVGEHDLCLDQVVDCQAAPAGQVAQAATKCETADAGSRDDPAGGGKAVLVGRSINFAPEAAAADPRGSGLGVDLDLLQARKVENDAIVTRSQPAAVVAAAAHR